MKNGGSNDRGKGTVTLTLGLPQFGMKFRLDVVFFFFFKRRVGCWELIVSLV